MSSTRNSKNLLTNVFRPAYVYDANGFHTSLVVSNVATVDTATLRSGTLAIGDAGGNIYVGSNSGIPYDTNNTNSNNVALGVGAAELISNVRNSVFIGSNAGRLLSNASDTTIIGTNDTVTGTRNVIIGSRDFVYGDNNVIIGSDISTNESYKLNIGNLILGDISLGGQLNFNANVVINGTLACALFAAEGLDTSNIGIDPQGYIRNGAGATPYNMDISSGNFIFAGTSASRVADVSFYRGRVDASAGISGTGFDLSSGLTLTGNISNSGTVTANNFVGTSSTSNSIGGVTLSSNNISYSGTITGSTDNTSNKIGGVTLNNTNISYAGAISNSVTNTSNVIGGVTLNNTSISYAGAISNSVTNTSNVIGGVTLNNTSISYAGAISNSVTNTSNVIGGVVLKNTIIGASVIRDSVTVPTIDMSSGNISNSATTRSGNFVTPTASSNSIGGVTLNSSNISNAGTVSATTFSGSLGGSHSIGGVTLINGYVLPSTGSAPTPSYTFTGTNSDCGMYYPGSNSLGFSVGSVARMTICGDKVGIGTTTPRTKLEVVGDISATNVYYTGAISNSTTNTSNLIGGVTLSNGKVGIGTTAPMYPLDICGSSASALLNLVSTFLPPIGNINGVLLYASNIPGGRTLNAFITGKDSGASNYGGVYYTHVGDGSVSNYMSLWNTNSNGVNVRQDGNVGIGTTTPASRLTVAGDISYSGALINAPSTSSNSIGGVTLSNGYALTGVGSASAPAHTFSTDTAMGAYRVGSQALGFAVGGSNRMTICGDKVGIGTTFPGYGLDVSGTSRVYGSAFLITSNDTSASGMRMVAASGDSFIQWGTSTVSNGTGSAALRFTGMNGTGEYMRITSNGYVGIGTTAPLGQLDVATGSVIVNRLGNLQSNTDAAMYVEGSSNIGMYLQKGSDNNNGGISFKTVSSGTFAERLRIDANTGRIGIGTTAPGCTLDVSSQFLPISLNRPIAGQNNYITFSNSGNLRWGIGVNNVDTGSGNGGSDFNLVAYTDLGASNSTPLLIKRSNGYVGIGTIAPTTLLDISGGNVQVISKNGSLLVADTSSAFIQLYNTSDTYGCYRANGTFDIFSNGTSRGSLPGTSKIRLSADSGNSWITGTNVGIGTSAPVSGMQVNAATDNIYAGNPLASNTVTIFGPARAAPVLAGTADLNATLFVNATTAFARNIGASVGLGGRGSDQGGGQQHQTWARINGVQRNDNDGYGGHFVIETNDSAGALRERMRITHAGYVGINTATPAYSLDICGTIRALDGLKQGTNTWGAYSDQRIKQNIALADISTCYSIVKNLPLKRFTWDSSYVPDLKDKNVVGWIAQDVEQVFNKAVSKTQAFGFEDVRILDVDQIYKTMYGALEKVIADKEILETRVATLETQLSNVLTRLTNAGL